MLTPAAWWVIVGGLALLLVGWALSYPEVALLGAALLLSVVAAALWLLSRPRLAVERAVDPERVEAGDDAVAWLSYRNLGRRRSAPLVAREQFGADQVELPLGPLQPGEEATISYRLPTHRRGVLEVGPLTLGARDPFGLLQATSARGEPAQLIVHPRAYPIDHLPSGRTRDLDGSAYSETSSGGIAFHSLRQYVVGDDLRLVHWRASAKAGTLLVRHNVDTVAPRTAVVLDTRAGVYDGDEFELAVSVAASLVTASARHHVPLQLHTTSGRATSVGSSSTHVDALDLLAELQPDDVGDLEALVGLAGSVRRGLSVAVVTGRGAVEDGTVALLSGGRHRLLDLVLVGADPDDPSLAWAEGVLIPARTAEDFVAGWEARVRP